MPEEKEMSPPNLDELEDIASEGTETKVSKKDLKSADLKTVKLILQTTNYFIWKLKNEKNIKSIEEVSTPKYTAKTYNFSYFSNILKYANFSPNFIYNAKVRGKSGALVFFSPDFRIVFKTVRDSELATLLANIDLFAEYHNTNTGSLLVRYLGIFSIKFKNSSLNFVLMENVLNGLYREIYDLKGEHVNRTNTNGILTEECWAEKQIPVQSRRVILEQLEKDTSFLRSLNLMDYSLILAKRPVLCHPEFKMYDFSGRWKGIVIPRPRTECVVGVVDTLTVYDEKKCLETVWNSLLCNCNMSSVGSERYQRRFLKMAEKCFKDSS